MKFIVEKYTLKLELKKCNSEELIEDSRGAREV